MTISRESTIASALLQLEETGSRLLVVVGDDNVLVGTLSDGDLRRAVLRGLSFETAVEEAANRAPVVGYEESHRDQLESVMRRLSLVGVPIVDSAKRVIDIVLAFQRIHKNKNDMPVILMAGGRGERLRPLTDSIPKPLLEISGRSLLSICITKLWEQGFHSIWISTYYRHEIIKQSVLDEFASYSELEINFLLEEVPLGTIGSFLLLPDSIKEQDVLVMNVDVIHEIDMHDFQEFHIRMKTAATILSTERSFEIPYGVLTQSSGRLVKFEEKPRYTYATYAGICIFRGGVLSNLIPGVPIDIPEVLRVLMENGESVSVYRSESFWMDVGTPSTWNSILNSKDWL